MGKDTKTGTVLKGILKYAVPLVVSIGLCWLLFTGIDFDEMLAIIREQCDLRWIVFGMIFAIGAQVCRAYRWRIQLRAIGVNPPIHALIYSIFGTYAVNLVFPRLGEVWRTGYIAQRQRAPFTAVFGSMVADRLADTAAVALILLFAFIVASKAIIGYLTENAGAYNPLISLLESPWLWGGIAVAAAAFFGFMKLRSGNSAVTKIQKAFRELWKGFAAIAHMRGKGKWLLLTAGIWTCYFTQLYVSFYAFPFTAGLLSSDGPQVALVAFTLGSIAMGVPSNGGIGPWQWAVIFGLGIYGLPAAQAGAFANLSLGTTTLLTIFLGIITFTGIAIDKRNNNRKHKQITEK